jgi:hypothetical protein
LFLSPDYHYLPIALLVAYNEARNRAICGEAIIWGEIGRERRKKFLLPHPHYLSTCKGSLSLQGDMP